MGTLERAQESLQTEVWTSNYSSFIMKQIIFCQKSNIETKARVYQALLLIQSWIINQIIILLIIIGNFILINSKIASCLLSKLCFDEGGYFLNKFR